MTISGAPECLHTLQLYFAYTDKLAMDSFRVTSPHYDLHTEENSLRRIQKISRTDRGIKKPNQLYAD